MNTWKQNFQSSHNVTYKETSWDYKTAINWTLRNGGWQWPCIQRCRRLIVLQELYWLRWRVSTDLPSLPAERWLDQSLTQEPLCRSLSATERSLYPRLHSQRRAPLCQQASDQLLALYHQPETRDTRTGCQTCSIRHQIKCTNITHS